MKNCPSCAELIQDAARACRFCGRELPLVAKESSGNPHRPVEEGILAGVRRWLDLLYAAIPDVVIITDEQFNIISSNPAVEEVFHYSPGELEGQPYTFLVAEEMLTDPAQPLRQAELLKNGYLFQDNYFFRRKNGQVFPASFNVVLIRDAHGEMKGAMGTIRDITEQLQAEATLRESEARYRTLFENAPIGLGVADLEGNLIAYNQAMLEPGNYTSEDIARIGNVAGLYFDPRERDRAISEAQRQGYLHRSAVRFRRKDGSWYAALLSLTPITIQGRQGWQAVVEDVTEQRRVQREIHLKDTALESAANAVMITDRNGRIMWVNPAFTRLTGYSEHEALGRKPNLLKSGHHEQPFYQQLWETILSGGVWHGEMVNRRMDGSLYNEEQTITPVVDEDGQISHFVAVKQDITRRKQEEVALQQRVSELAALYDASQVFLGQLEPGGILDSLCRLAVERFGVKMAWVGLVEGGGAAVKPASVFGFEDGFLASIEVTRDGSPTGQGPTGTAIHMGQAAVVQGIDSDPDDAPWREAALQRGYRSSAALPLRHGDQILGALNLYTAQAGDFPPDRMRVLQSLANQATVALQGARLLAESRRQTVELAGLYETVLTTAGRLEVEELIERLDLQVRKLIRPDTLVLALFDEETKELEIVRAVEQGQVLPRLKVALADSGLTGWLVRTRQPILVEDLQVEPLPVMPRHITRPARAWLGVPLIAGERLVGAISLQSFKPGAFDQTHRRFLEAVAGPLAIALENARLFEDARRRLRKLQALQEVDVAISGSLDLRVTLDVLLGQVQSQLGVDAADVLLRDSRTQTLEYAARRGFTTGALRQSPLNPGEGFPGRAAEQRRTIAILDLGKSLDDLMDLPLLAREKFVSYFAVPLIAKGEVKGVLEIFHRTPLNPDQEWLGFLEALAGQAAIAIDNAGLYNEAQRATEELSAAYDATLEGWSRALELRDMETEGHAQRVTEMALHLARAMGVGEMDLVHVRRGALLHDIGKMGIPDSILRKPGPLTEAEWAIMHRHPVYAYELLSPIPFLRPALEIPYCHHEKWDGTGYPRGLRGVEIPSSARIFAVVDVWDALGSDRPYRKAWRPERALDYIQEQAGQHFDPEVVKMFLRLLANNPGPS